MVDKKEDVLRQLERAVYTIHLPLVAKVAELLRVAEQIGDKYVHGEGTDEEVEEWNSAIRAMRGDV